MKEQHIKRTGCHRQLLIDSIKEQMDVGAAYEFGERRLFVFVIGVNGWERQLHCWKLAGNSESGIKVILAAADTFRAAAGEQLKEWANRASRDDRRREGADPASVVFDTVAAARSKKSGYFIVRYSRTSSQ